MAQPIPRMSKGNRREQLLDLAFKMIQSKGTDALTLTKLAEEAKLTKPITSRIVIFNLNKIYCMRCTDVMMNN